MVATEESKDKAAAKPGKKEPEEEELSEEDAALKEKIDLLVDRVRTGDPQAQLNAIEALGTEIRSATTTMTSVPAPLKFLTPHYAALRETHGALGAGASAAAPLADVLSVVAMVAAKEGSRECLRFRLAGAGGEVGTWGHEYVRFLAGEVGEEVVARRAARGPDVDVAELSALVEVIVPYDLARGAEPEAIDLLLEVDAIGELARHVAAAAGGVDAAASGTRVARYLRACASYLPEGDDAAALRSAHAVHMACGQHAEALGVGLALGDDELVSAAWAAAADGGDRRQLAYVLGAAGYAAGPETPLLEGVVDEEARASYWRCLSNAQRPEQYAALARDLDVLEPKLPEDVYKSHLVEGRSAGAAAVDSARANLAATFVNGFVNAGFGRDKLVAPAGADGTADDDSVHWVFKNKEHGKMSAAASLGLVMLWDLEAGLPAIDRFLYATDPWVVGGALLGVGVLASGVADDVDPALALLSEYVSGEAGSAGAGTGSGSGSGAGAAPPGGASGGSLAPRTGAALGLGIAYAGRAREEVADLLCPLVSDPETPLETATAAALGLGLAFAGTAHGPCVEAALHALLLRGEAERPPAATALLGLALGLLFLRAGEAVEATVEVARTLEPEAAAPLVATLRACAYAGTGDVLQVQELLAVAGDLKDSDPETTVPESGAEAVKSGAETGAGQGSASTARSAPAPPAGQKPGGQKSAGLHQTIAVLGVALVAGGEELGSTMAYRMLEHLLQYGTPAVRRGVPLALAVLNVSNPEVGVVDTLSRLSHDADGDVAGAAILALGLVGAGTNNARLAGLLRGLSSYYAKEPTLLFLTRIAQGLAHAGKGLLTLDPFYSDRTVLAPAALGGILVVLFASLDAKACLAGRQHYLLYTLAAALRPRWLLTVDEQGKSLPVSVRVGTAVDVVAQAGRPKAITGFQTHTTPVLLAAGERAELGTTQYLPVTSVLEGIVVLRPNPDYVASAE